MRPFAALTAAFGLLASAPAAALGQLEFDGRFSEVRSSGEECDQVFAETLYQATHALAGPSQRTSVLRLAREGGGFLDGLVLVGLLGGSNDLYYDKTLQTDRLAFDVHAEGFIDRSVIYLEFEVAGIDEGRRTVCTATATYSGFN